MMRMHSLRAPVRDDDVTRVSVIDDIIYLDESVHVIGDLIRDRMYNRLFDHDAVAECAARFASSVGIH